MAASRRPTRAEAIAACALCEHDVQSTVVTVDLDECVVGIYACGADGSVQGVVPKVALAGGDAPCRDAAAGLAAALAHEADVADAVVSADDLNRVLAQGRAGRTRVLQRYFRSHGARDPACLTLRPMGDAIGEGSAWEVSCSGVERAFDQTTAGALDLLLEAARQALKGEGIDEQQVTFELAGHAAGVLALRRAYKAMGSDPALTDPRFPQDVCTEAFEGVVQRGLGYLDEGRARVGVTVGHSVELLLHAIGDAADATPAAVDDVRFLLVQEGDARSSIGSRGTSEPFFLAKGDAVRLVVDGQERQWLPTGIVCPSQGGAVFQARALKEGVSLAVRITDVSAGTTFDYTVAQFEEGR